LTSPNSCRCIR